jgi:membrane-associated protease RseP (regulator of RpoE activity)
MFHEPASSFDDDHLRVRRPTAFIQEAAPEESHYSEIREAVSGVMSISDEEFAIEGDTEKQRRNLFLISPDSQLLMTFTGRLRVAPEVAYDQLDALFKPYDLLPIFRQQPAKLNPETGDMPPSHQIYVVQGRVKPKEGGGWLSLILFVLTVLSVLFVGSIMAINNMDNIEQARAMMQNPLPELWRGWPYASSILLILGAHEMGHYLAARYHGTAASLPYFLPFPFGIFGTFGAAIRLREPMRNRKVLFDIGAAGPLAGLVFAVPILLIGLATSEVDPVTGGFVEGNSILYAVSKIVVFGEFLPSGGMDVHVNQLAWAGWTGLLVTGLNLIPVGQLDGGHVLYALLGRFASVLYYPIVGALVLLTVFVATELLIFVLLILLLGNLHAIPLDDITRLDSRRQALAVFTLVVFVLVFVPSPLRQVESGNSGPPVEPNLVLLPVAMIWLWLNAGRGSLSSYNGRRRRRWPRFGSQSD